MLHTLIDLCIYGVLAIPFLVISIIVYIVLDKVGIVDKIIEKWEEIS